MSITNVKCVFVGDTAVGKSSLLHGVCSGACPVDHIPTVFDNFATDLESDAGERYSLGLWDTAGLASYDRLRPLSYPGGDIVFFVFDVSKRASLSSIRQRWMNEILEHFEKNLFLVLVGNKIDLRSNPDLACLTFEEGRMAANQIGAFYIELTRYYSMAEHQQVFLRVLLEREQLPARVQNSFLEWVLAMSSLDLPAYVLLEVYDSLHDMLVPPYNSQLTPCEEIVRRMTHRQKIKIIINVCKFRNKRSKH